MQFSVVRKTYGGLALLKSDSGEKVEHPMPLFEGKKKVGKVVETIGRVSEPFYIGQVEAHYAIEGKTFVSAA